MTKREQLGDLIGFLVVMAFLVLAFSMTCQPAHADGFLTADDQSHIYGTVAFSGAVFQVWNPSKIPLNKIDPLVPFLSGIALELFVQKIDHPSYIDPIHLICGFEGSMIGTTGCCLIRILEQ